MKFQGGCAIGRTPFFLLFADFGLIHVGVRYEGADAVKGGCMWVGLAWRNNW